MKDLKKLGLGLVATSAATGVFFASEASVAHAEEKTNPTYRGEALVDWKTAFNNANTSTKNANAQYSNADFNKDGVVDVNDNPDGQPGVSNYTKPAAGTRGTENFVVTNPKADVLDNPIIYTANENYDSTDARYNQTDPDGFKYYLQEAGKDEKITVSNTVYTDANGNVTDRQAGLEEKTQAAKAEEREFGVKDATRYEDSKPTTITERYDTIWVANPYMKQGETQVIVEGQVGAQEITYRKYYKGAVLIGKETIFGKKTPKVDRVIAVGTAVEQKVDQVLPFNTIFVHEGEPGATAVSGIDGKVTLTYMQGKDQKGNPDPASRVYVGSEVKYPAQDRVYVLNEGDKTVLKAQPSTTNYVSFSTIYVPDTDLLVGSTRQGQKGRNGKIVESYDVVDVKDKNGAVRETLTRNYKKVVTEAVPEIIYFGVKPFEGYKVVNRPDDFNRTVATPKDPIDIYADAKGESKTDAAGPAAAAPEAKTSEYDEVALKPDYTIENKISPKQNEGTDNHVSTTDYVPFVGGRVLSDTTEKPATEDPEANKQVAAPEANKPAAASEADKPAATSEATKNTAATAPAKDNKAAKKADKKTTPKTGVVASVAPAVLGLALASVGSAFTFKKKED